VWRAARHEDESGDDRLIEGLRRGAPAALAGLHEQYAAGIYSLALRVVRHAPDAEDITQDVLIRAFERLPKDREVLLRPWLYRLTLNRCYDHLRVSARRPLAAPGRDVASPHDPFEQSEMRRLLEATIADLTRRQQAALLLKDVHGLSLVEVAACLELTPGSVEVLLARARRAFRASYEQRCTAAGRPLPRSAGGLLALPLLPLPPGLAAPAVPFVPPAPHLPVPVFSPPLTLAAGSGIGAVLGLPASLKTAVLIAAAAATVGTAEVAVRHPGHRPAARTPSAAAVAERVTRTQVESPVAGRSASAAGHAVASSSPSPTAEPQPSPSATEVVEPSPMASPLGVLTPSATPEPSTMPTPVETPTGSATSPSPSPSPTLYASPAASASPVPSPSPSPAL
jgi:RNA polymerase sigma factor (sigma-70 family)